MPKIESLLLSTVCVQTYNGAEALTNATAFFFEIGQRLFLVSCRHVLYDDASNHKPNRIDIILHDNANNIASFFILQIPLYGADGTALWRETADNGGSVDVAAIEVSRDVLPEGFVYGAFTPDTLQDPSLLVSLGTPALVIGFPLGFQDTLHQLPVARQAIVASSFGLRFQGKGYFLTDGRTHRGISGAPVIRRATEAESVDNAFPWILLGIHASRLDIGSRDVRSDEALGLNCAWYADVLLSLTS